MFHADTWKGRQRDVTRSPSADLRKRMETLQCVHSLQFLEVYSLVFNYLENGNGDSYNINLTFICPCIANIFPNYNQQDAMFLNLFISTVALYVSGSSSAHHQEHTTVHTASGIVNQYCCLLL